ncbi:MAG: hypothetical protein U9O20_03295 [Patescibacteria group bacterium]|nr:hypothetical protein [Patescibacteria group bacterium]
MDILINLLSPTEKEEIKNLRRVGVILKIGFSAICAMGVFVVFLFFTMKAIQIQQDVVLKEIARFEQSFSYKEVKVAQEALREYSKTASKVKNGLSNQKLRWELVSEISAVIPNDIKIVEFSVDSKDVLTLNGIAYTRDALLQLQEELEGIERITKIESPISNFVADKDVEFEFTAEIKK